jgi:hypothetical protein
MDFTGKPMRGFVYVGPEGCKSDKTLLGWINSSLNYVKSLS